MTIFQQVGLPVIGLCAIATLIAVVRHQIGVRIGLLWFAVWIAAAIVIADPMVSVRLARAVGIGRGADLVVYSAIIVMVFGFFVVYLRFKRLEHEITVLVRHLAIRDAEPPRTAPGDVASPATS
jgi:hypothetical protein